MPLFSIVLPERVHAIRLSDNSSFWDQGYPALMLTDTSFLRNPHYHAPSDTPATLDYARMAEAVRGVSAGVASVAADAGGDFVFGTSVQAFVYTGGQAGTPPQTVTPFAAASCTARLSRPGFLSHSPTSSACSR